MTVQKVAPAGTPRLTFLSTLAIALLHTPSVFGVDGPGLAAGTQLGRPSFSGCGKKFSSPQDITPINISSAANPTDYISRVTWIKAPRNLSTPSVGSLSGGLKAPAENLKLGSNSSSPEPQHIAVFLQRLKDTKSGRYYSSKNGTAASMPILVGSPGFIGMDTWVNLELQISVPYVHQVGAILVTFLKPGMWNDTAYKEGDPLPSRNSSIRPICSDGTQDGGAEVSRAYLSAVVDFVSGGAKDIFGNSFNSSALAGQEADLSNVGVYASSHGGMLLYRALAESGLPGAKWVMSWESPLQDVMLTGEIGNKVDSTQTAEAIETDNPFSYGSSLTSASSALSIGVAPAFSSASPSLPYQIPINPITVPRAYDGTRDFRLNGLAPDTPFVKFDTTRSNAWPDTCRSESSVIGSSDCHRTDNSGGLFNYPYVSLASVHLTNRLCTLLGCQDCRPSTFKCTKTKKDGTEKDLWPSHIGNPKQVNQWQHRAMVGLTYEDDGYHEFNHFPEIASARDLKANPLRVMLLYAKIDHGSGAGLDKPKLELAYRNLRKLDLWVKLNPSKVYLDWVFSGTSSKKLCTLYDSNGNAKGTSVSKYCSPYFPDVPPNQQPRWTADTSVSTSLDQSTIRHSEAVAKAYVGSGGSENRGVTAYIAKFGQTYKLGAFAEMMDRTRNNEWGTSNLSSTLESVTAP